ncbi:MAG: PIN domain-containing protein [Candidatus Micrarchaeota archaeon]
MIFVDTSFLIAYAVGRDANHGRANEIRQQEEGETLVLTSHNIEETATFLSRREGKAKAREIAAKLLTSSEAQVVFPDRELLLKATEVLGSRDGLSLCDALAVVVMRELGIRKIASFDSDFDRFPGILRLC